MDAVTVRAPGIVQAAVALRDAAHAQASPRKVVSIAYAVQQLKNFASDADGSLTASMKNNASGDTRLALQALAKSLQAASTKVLDESQFLIDGKPADQLDGSVADLIGRADQAWPAANSELNRLLQARVDRLTSNLFWKLGEVALLLGVTMAVLIVIARGITRPLVGLTAAMRKLADGDFHTVLPGLGRSDEIGEIARAVEAFKVKAEGKSSLEADERMARQAKDAEAQAALSREREAAALAREEAAFRAAEEQSKVAAERERAAAEQADAMKEIRAAVARLAAEGPHLPNGRAAPGALRARPSRNSTGRSTNWSWRSARSPPSPARSPRGRTRFPTPRTTSPVGRPSTPPASRRPRPR